LLNVISGLLGEGTPVSTNSYESIATLSGTGASDTISFTSIPSTYKHLQLRAITKATAAAGGTDMRITFNGDTGSNYAYHALQGNGSSAVAFGGSSQTYIRNQSLVDGSYANVYQGVVIDILDYANTSKNKTLRMLTGFDANGDGFMRLLSGLWTSTSAINRVDFVAPSTTWTTGTTIALYGIKG
jgi:hypothetical protein